jgi:hypothetical protein
MARLCFNLCKIDQILDSKEFILLGALGWMHLAQLPVGERAAA